MREPLNTRIQKQRELSKRLVRNERIAETFAKKIEKVIPDADVNISVYEKSLFFTVSGLRLDLFEDSDMLPIAIKFKMPKWDRSITEHSVTYSFQQRYKNLYLYFNFTCAAVEGVCEIVTIPTGIIEKVSKWVTVEQERVEYAVSCKG